MVAVLALSEGGVELGRRLAAVNPKYAVYAFGQAGQPDTISYQSLSATVAELFFKVEGFVFIMASGIAVRVLAPLLKEKRHEPGAIVVDERGDYAISLVGGHEGGANLLAYEVAAILQCDPIVTTGSEVGKDLVVGVGCRRGADCGAIVSALSAGLARVGRGFQEVKSLATIAEKRDEPGLIEAASRLGLPVRFISRAAIANQGWVTMKSAAAARAFGVDGVCEPAALLAGKNMALILPKQNIGGVTVAIAERRRETIGQ